MGDKYGYRPVPSSIEDGVFEALMRHGGAGADWPVVGDWYRKDDNARPACYMLQPISSKIDGYTSVRMFAPSNINIKTVKKNS